MLIVTHLSWHDGANRNRYQTSWVVFPVRLQRRSVETEKKSVSLLENANCRTHQNIRPRSNALFIKMPMRSCNWWSHEKGYRRISNLDSFMTKALNEFRSLEIFDETARVNLMHENKIKIPLTPVGEILPRGKRRSLTTAFAFLYESNTFFTINFFFKLYWRFPSTHCYQNSYLKRRVLISIFCNLITCTFFSE